jgi:hypothetical protein
VKPITVEVRMHSDATLVEPVTLGNPYNLSRNKAFFFYARGWQRQGGVLDTFPAASTMAGYFDTITLMVTD